MVLPIVIDKRIRKIEEHLRRLDEMSKTPKEEFLRDWKIQDVVLRNFQVVMDACCDIGAHLISKEGKDVPDTYAGVIERLQELKILPEDLADKIVDLVKFRNIIVHEYLYLDMEKVYEKLQELDYIREFVKCIVNFYKGKNA
jgi:uncharacterized protein YutE (UPF0331/DUF86 family)